MPANSVGCENSRNQLDPASQNASTAELPAPATSVESMRAGLAAQIDTLPDQIIRDMFRLSMPVRHRHAIDFRVSIWLPLIARFYCNFSAGREQRNPQRLAGEGLTNSSRRAEFLGIIIIALVGYCLFGIICFLYILKSMFKINIFAGQSPFHPLYVLFLPDVLSIKNIQ